MARVMKKRRRVENKKSKIKTDPDKEKQVRFVGRIKRFYAIVPVIATLMALYWGLTPSISVRPNTMLENGGNAILTPFTVYNNGRFPIYNVKISCAPKYIRGSDGLRFYNFSSDGKDYGAIFTYSNVFVKKVAAGGEYAQYIPLANWAKSGFNPTEGDMAIIVSFRIIKFAPFEFNRKFRFISAKSKDGSLVWIEEPF
jgi:hypothetical protein